MAAVKVTLSIAKSQASALEELIFTVVTPSPGRENIAAPKLPAEAKDMVIESPKLSETV
jgi:hypothetical protein